LVALAGFRMSWKFDQFGVWHRFRGEGKDEGWEMKD
jgi:hypothetical protein